MNRGMNKERVVFLIGAAVFLWVMVKLGFFWTRPRVLPSVARAAAAAIQRGDSSVQNFMRPSTLVSYLRRGGRDPFFPSAQIPPTVFLRQLVSHSVLRSVVFSRFTIECRMMPRPAPELRLRVPQTAKITDVFSRELDKGRQWGVDDGVLVVPLAPARLKRGYYSCRVTVLLRAPLTPPTKWRAPNVMATTAMPAVDCEVGYLVVATPGDHVTLNPIAEGKQGGRLMRARLEDLPKEVSLRATQFAYSFSSPDYELVFAVQAPTVVAQRPTKPETGPVVKTKPPVVKTKPPVVKTKPPAVNTKPPQPVETRIVIPTVGDPETLPFKPVGIVRTDEPEPKGQVIFSHKESGEILRALQGQTIIEGYHVASITNDRVVVRDDNGKLYVLRLTRFPDKDN